MSVAPLAGFSDDLSTHSARFQDATGAGWGRERLGPRRLHLRRPRQARWWTAEQARVDPPLSWIAEQLAEGRRRGDSEALWGGGAVVVALGFDLVDTLERLPGWSAGGDGGAVAYAAVYGTLRASGVPPASAPPLGGDAPAAPDQAATDYVEKVRRVQAYLRAGDCYQVNLSQPFSRAWSGDADRLAESLWERTASPYGALIRWGEGALAGGSPELFLRVRDDVVTTEPIKGTRPRHPDPEQDRALAAGLLASAKDRAENVMIVDLMRNDLGRICQPGSVAVTDLFALESHPTVHHLVSRISGRLRRDRSLTDVLAATFPGGSVTGAPKLRAVEIIRELEPAPRGMYTGCYGWLGFDGAASLAMTIRSLVLGQGLARCHAGSAVVMDSDPQAEYEESLLKARALLEVVA